jgi:hypothetical protein
VEERAGVEGLAVGGLRRLGEVDELGDRVGDVVLEEAEEDVAA